MRSTGLEPVLGLLVTRVMLRAQLGGSPKAVETAGSLMSQSAEATEALGPGPQQEETGAGHLGRALRGTLWGALGRGHFKRRLARPLGLLAGHLGGNSVNLKPNPDALWICETSGHCFLLWNLSPGC